jgi:aquaporin Z
MTLSAIRSHAFDQTTQRAALVEFIGTFGLALVAFRTRNAAFVGLTLLVFVYVIGGKSGCHINPGVTAGLVAAGRFPLGAGIVYIIMQILGAILAHFVAALFPGGSVALASSGFVGEFFGFAFLILTVAAVTENEVPPANTGIAIGSALAIGLAASGGILNPAIAIAAGEIISWAVLMPLLAGPVFALLYTFFMRNVQPPR